jgi:hypothetical protein
MGAFILQFACLATSLFLASFVAEAGEIDMARSNRSADTAKNNPVSRVEAGHLDADNSIRDLLNHSAFRG